MTTLAGSYNGLNFGVGTDVHVAAIRGLEDLPQVRSADELRAGDQGAFMGLDFVGVREVEIDFHLIAANAAAYETLRDLFKAAMIPSQHDELPLKLYGSTRRVNARVKRRHVPVQCDQIQRVATATVQFVATDPRVYDETESSQSVGLPTVSGGVAFPVTFPLSFGSVSTGGLITATNLGNFPARPVAVITGPVTNPRIENVTEGKTLSFAITLATGETLTIDFDTRSILLNGTASRRSTLIAGSQWWEIDPGVSTIRYQANSYTAGSTLQLTWRSAWL